jgi:2-dehydropantoate 2-reductase
MGASLAALTASQLPTVIVARDPARARAIRAGGIELSGRLTGFGRPDVVDAIDALADIHPIDLVFIATKTTAIPAVCAAMRPHLAELPYLVSYQNGIEPGRTIVRTLGTPRVVRMVLRYGAVLEPGSARDGPLRVRVTLHDPPHAVGGEGVEAQDFARGLARRFTEMGLPTLLAPDIEVPVWRKSLENAASGPVAALVRAPLGELLASPARPLIERLLDEGIAVARAAGIALGEGFRAEVLAVMQAGGEHLPSMAADVIAGRATEITQLNEQVAERGRALGVPTPTHDAIIDLIRTFDWRTGRPA